VTNERSECCIEGFESRETTSGSLAIGFKHRRTPSAEVHLASLGELPAAAFCCEQTASSERYTEGFESRKMKQKQDYRYAETPLSLHRHPRVGANGGVGVVRDRDSQSLLGFGTDQFELLPFGRLW